MLAADAPLTFICHAQLQLGGGPEVVDVLESATFAQDFAELDVHAAFIGISERPDRPHPIGGDHVSVAFDVESTEVATAFQPSVPQEVVQLFEGSVGLYLYIHPEDGREGVLDAQTKEPYDFSPGRFVLGQRAPQVAGHCRFGSALTAEGADAVGGKPAHIVHSILVFLGAKRGQRYSPQLKLGRAQRTMRSSGRVGYRKR